MKLLGVLTKVADPQEQQSGIRGTGERPEGIEMVGVVCLMRRAIIRHPHRDPSTEGSAGTRKVRDSNHLQPATVIRHLH